MTGNELKKRLRLLDKTQEVLAKDLGVSRQTLNNWFSKAELSDEIVQIVNNALYGGAMFSKDDQLSTLPLIESDEKVSIPQSALDIIMAQTKCLAKKDEHIDKLIDMLDNRLSALEKSNDSAVSSVPTSNIATAGENEK